MGYAKKIQGIIADTPGVLRSFGLNLLAPSSRRASSIALGVIYTDMYDSMTI